MTETLRLNLEAGKARRVVAGATDWPGLDRWGRSEEDALPTLLAFVPRYAAGRPARTWPIHCLFRRTAQHVMDHAWELEDCDMGAGE